MKLSIITPCRDDQSSLIKCVESTANYADDIEHIVFDSSTESILKRRPSLLERFPHLSYFHETDDGPGHAIAKGLSHAKGKYVAFLMANDEFIGRNIQAVLKDINERPSDILVYGYFVHSKLAVDKRSVKGNLKTDKIVLEQLLFDEFYLSRMVIDRKLIAKIGGINEELRIANDRDLILRLFFERPTITVSETPILKFCYEPGSISNRSDVKTKVRILDEHVKIAQTLSNHANLRPSEKRQVSAWRRSSCLHKNILLSEIAGPAHLVRVSILAISFPLTFLSLYRRKCSSKA